MRYQGKLTQWNDTQGFGFITPNGGGERVFVHIKSFRSSEQRPAENAMLTYELRNDTKGRPRADSVAFVGATTRSVSAPSRGDSRWPPLLAGGFVVALALACLKGQAPLSIVGLYAGASLVAFIAYAWDKSAARRNEWRTPENTLHLLALAGGWPGALLAQKTFRHKTKKQSFRTVFWLTVALNCGALGWLLVAPGAAPIRANLGGA
jgi:uncharacterized membrane protein YsdA (DUF1294 family)/cold shock CspA family protein